MVLCARDAAAAGRGGAAAADASASWPGHPGPTPATWRSPTTSARVVARDADSFGRESISWSTMPASTARRVRSRTVDWGEWMRAIEINLYGSVLMCRAVSAVISEARRGKIVQLSGGGATNPLPRISAYAVSKAAIVRFVETLAEEVRDEHIDVNAIAPGALNTRMLDEVLEAGPRKGRAGLLRTVPQAEGIPAGRRSRRARSLPCSWPPRRATASPAS